MGTDIGVPRTSHLIICIGLAHLLLCDDHEYPFSSILTLHLLSSLSLFFFLSFFRFAPLL